ncbi:substrate-binding domain-containing protein [Acuticoccus sp. I52.16.1]|uniref:substrate-binding domain-containing protein n=1 Tax=Acuticoccus sp. I52.16.1 TaxID=2928472 RepID=UPI001FCFE13C|nr:substrate-binding domain-containing protein [Acuticoccus sp. I52.16.1]UOM35453.1 substrate-binding domain-containing protein [Acuticoccus sp. I52.16.1]
MPAWAADRSPRRALTGALAAALTLAVGGAAAQQTGFGADLELVDQTVLRVCADPSNLPLSNEAGEGYENKLAELIAAKLGREGVTYAYFPQGVGFVRNTLRAFQCDVIMGFAQGNELVQSTNPYFRTAYALVVPQSSPLADVTSLSDPRLADARLGVVAGTPPATTLARNGLIGKARPYQLMVDTRIDHPIEDMFADMEAGEIDGALAWGPMAGWYAEQADPPHVVIPLVHEDGGPRMTYRITMGVRPSDQEWKRTLNRVIRENQDEINAILLDFGVPLLDEHDQPITGSAD